MCPWPAELDRGSGSAVALFRAAPDNDCFKTEANFEFSSCLVSDFKREIFSYVVLCY